MWSRTLAFLRDEGNRAVLGLIGGALAAVGAGIWAVFVYLHPVPGEKPKAPTVVEANCGSVAVGGSVSGSTITNKGSAGFDCSSKER